MQKLNPNGALGVALPLSFLALAGLLATACNQPTPAPANCTPLSQAPAPFAGTSFPSANTTLGFVLAQGAGHRAAISVASTPSSGSPVTFSARLWDGTQWSSASMSSAYQTANIPLQLFAGSDWLAVGSIQSSSATQPNAVYWDQTDASAYSTPNTFPGFPVNDYSQPLAIAASPVDQHVGVVVVNYTASSQLSLVERPASGSDSSWTSSQIQIGGVAVTGLALALAYDGNNLPWLVVRSNSGTPSLSVLFRDGSNTWHQLPALNSPAFSTEDTAIAAMFSPTSSQLMIVWTEKQAASTPTQFVANLYGSFVDTATEKVSPPSVIANNLTDTSSVTSASFELMAAASNDGTRGLIEAWGYASHQLWYAPVSRDANGNSQFLSLQLQPGTPVLPPWIFYDQCGDIASAVETGSGPDYAAGTTIMELSGY